MFYSLNTSLLLGHDIITMEMRKFSDVLGPHVEKLLILSKGGSYRNNGLANKQSEPSLMFKWLFNILIFAT